MIHSNARTQTGNSFIEKKYSLFERTGYATRNKFDKNFQVGRQSYATG